MGNAQDQNQEKETTVDSSDMNPQTSENVTNTAFDSTNRDSNLARHNTNPSPATFGTNTPSVSHDTNADVGYNRMSKESNDVNFRNVDRNVDRNIGNDTVPRVDVWQQPVANNPTDNNPNNVNLNVRVNVPDYNSQAFGTSVPFQNPNNTTHFDVASVNTTPLPNTDTVRTRITDINNPSQVVQEVQIPATTTTTFTTQTVPDKTFVSERNESIEVQRSQIEKQELILMDQNKEINNRLQILKSLTVSITQNEEKLKMETEVINQRNAQLAEVENQTKNENARLMNLKK